MLYAERDSNQRKALFEISLTRSLINSAWIILSSSAFYGSLYRTLIYID